MATFLTMTIFVAACSLDSLLAERKTISHGEFHGFQIGEHKGHVLDHVAALGVYQIVNPEAEINDRSIYKLEGLSQLDRARLLSTNSWEFEVVTETPAGAFYEMHFVGDELSEIEYMRPRFRK